MRSKLYSIGEEQDRSDETLNVAAVGEGLDPSPTHLLTISDMGDTSPPFIFFHKNVMFLQKLHLWERLYMGSTAYDNLSYQGVLHNVLHLKNHHKEVRFCFNRTIVRM